MRTVVYRIATVAARSWPSSVLLRGGATRPTVPEKIPAGPPSRKR